MCFLSGTRAGLFVIAVAGSLAVGYAAVGVTPWLAGTSPVAEAAALPGFGTLTGTVTAPAPFKAARVLLRNTDKRILYMVYTGAGQFRATALFPGNYDVSSSVDKLQSAVQKIVIRAGDNPKVSIALSGPAGATDRAVVTALETEGAADTTTREEAGYDEIYPAGPGRDIAERTCMICHGENFISTRPGTPASWAARIDRMMGAQLSTKSPASYAEGLLTYRASALRFSREDRQVLLDYLSKNFGLNAKPRAVRIDHEIPLDEAKLSKAMYMEYYLNEDPPGQLSHSPEVAKMQGAFVGRRVGQDVRFDAEGDVWLTDRGYPNRIVRLDPRTGEQKAFVLPNPISGNHDINIDRLGMIWVAEPEGQQPSAQKHLNMFNPKTETFELRIPMDPNNEIRSENKWMQSMAFDSKNNVYVGWIMGGAISKYDRESKKVSVFMIPTHNAIPYGIVADRNDNLWMALWDSGSIAKFDTTNNQWTTFTPLTYPGQIRRLNVDAQNNVWFAMWAAGKRPGRLGKIDQTTGKITEYVVPRQNANPYDVAQDMEGNIWVADVGGSASSLYKFNPRDGSFTLYPKPQKTADTPKVMVTRDGAVWYSPRGSQKDPAFGVLYPDMDKITTLGAFYLNGPPGYLFKPAAAPDRRSTQ